MRSDVLLPEVSIGLLLHCRQHNQQTMRSATQPVDGPVDTRSDSRSEELPKVRAARCQLGHPWNRGHGRPVMALSEIPQSCSTKFPASRGQVSAGGDAAQLVRMGRLQQLDVSSLQTSVVAASPRPFNDLDQAKPLVGGRALFELDHESIRPVKVPVVVDDSLSCEVDRLKTVDRCTVALDGFDAPSAVAAGVAAWRRSISEAGDSVSHDIGDRDSRSRIIEKPTHDHRDTGGKQHADNEPGHQEKQRPCDGNAAPQRRRRCRAHQLHRCLKTFRGSALVGREASRSQLKPAPIMARPQTAWHWYC